MMQGTWVTALALAAVLAGTSPGQERVPRLGILPNYEDARTAAGVLVAEVAAESPAARAGLKAGDRIIGLAGKPVKGIPDYILVMKELRMGDSVDVRIARNGKELIVKAKLE